MARQNDIPAFPRPASVGFGEMYRHEQEGMTLRDWFAGQAVTNMNFRDDWGSIARRAYQLADAMLAERTRGTST